MPVFIAHRDRSLPSTRNAAQTHAALVEADDAADALQVLQANAFSGEVKGIDGWTFTQIGTGTLPSGYGPVSWIVGDLIRPGEARPGQ